MLQPIEIRRRTRRGATPDVAVTEYSAGVGLVCPYFHQRFITPDPRYLICEGRFGEQADIVRIDLTTAEGVRLTTAGAVVHVGDMAPDGRRFFFVRDHAIWWVDIITGEEVCFADTPSEDGYEPLSCLHFSADGRGLAMGGNREHASGVPEGRVWAVDTETGEAEPVVDRPFRIGHVQCSTSDSRLLMYCHETGGASPQRIWLARMDGAHPGAVFPTPGHPWVTHETFTGDGRWIVFTRNPEGLGMIRGDNTGFRAFGVPGAWHPGPSHKGDRVLYDTHGGDIGLLRTATGETVTLACGQYGGSKSHPHPRFSPDDRTAVWTCTAGELATVCIADTGGLSA